MTLREIAGLCLLVGMSGTILGGTLMVLPLVAHAYRKEGVLGAAAAVCMIISVACIFVAIVVAMEADMRYGPLGDGTSQ